MNHTKTGRNHDSGQNLPELPAAKARDRFLSAGQGRLQADSNGHLQGLPRGQGAATHSKSTRIKEAGAAAMISRRANATTMIAPPPLAVPRKETARELGLSITTVDRAIKRGDLVAKKYGARVLVPRAEIERYLANLKSASEKPPEV